MPLKRRKITVDKIKKEKFSEKNPGYVLSDIINITIKNLLSTEATDPILYLSTKWLYKPNEVQEQNKHVYKVTIDEDLYKSFVEKYPKTKLSQLVNFLLDYFSSMEHKCVDIYGNKISIQEFLNTKINI